MWFYEYLGVLVRLKEILYQSWAPFHWYCSSRLNIAQLNILLTRMSSLNWFISLWMGKVFMPWREFICYTASLQNKVEQLSSCGICVIFLFLGSSINKAWFDVTSAVLLIVNSLWCQAMIKIIIDLNDDSVDGPSYCVLLSAVPVQYC